MAYPARPGTRALFSALAFTRRPLERQWITTELWPDEPEASAKANLRRHLAYVAGWLTDTTGHPEPVVRTGSLVSLAPSTISSVDVHTFLDGIASNDFEAAVSAYGGDLLEDRDEPWIAPQRIRLRGLHADALRHLLDEALAMRDFETALRHAEAARVADPYAEDFLRAVMRVRYAAGDRAGALNAYERHRTLIATELDLEPMPETILLADSMRRLEVPTGTDTDRAPRRSAETTLFVGRVAERNAVAEALSDARLVTITGAPGAGKTRLALHSARAYASDLGVALRVIDVGSAGGAEQLQRAVIRALDDRADGAPAPSFEDAISGCDAVIVLDGCERIRDECAAFVSHLIDRSDARVIATSRIPLGLEAERLVRLGPLRLEDSVELFRVRIRASNVEPVTSEAEELVDRICRKLDGLPLAIELAAARARVSTLAQVERDVRTYDARPGRNLLHAAYDSSYALLSDVERAVWLQLAFFTNGCNEIVALAACARIADPTTLRAAMSTLVQHSLVVPPGLHDVATRYAMLDATRDYARHKANELGELDDESRAHAQAIARHYVSIGTRLRAGQAAHYYSEVERDRENIDAALDTLASGDASQRALATDLCLAVSRFWADQGYAREGERRLRVALDSVSAEDGARRLELIRVAGTLARDLGDYAGSYRDFLELARLHVDTGSALERAKAQTLAANAARMLNLFDEAIDLTREAFATFDAHGEAYLAAWAVYATGTILLSAARNAEAAIELERATDLFNDVDAAADSSSSIANLALCAYYDGRYETAAELTRESIRRASDAGHRYYYAHAILNEAAISHALGATDAGWRRVLEARIIALALDSIDLRISCAETAAALLAPTRPDESTALLASADRARHAAHSPRFPVDVPGDERLREALLTALGRARFEACLARGRVTGLRGGLERLA